MKNKQSKYTELTRYFVNELGLDVEMTEREIAFKAHMTQPTVHRLLESAMRKVKQNIQREVSEHNE